MSSIMKNIEFFVKGIKLIKNISPGFLSFSIIQSALNALLPFINIYMSGIIMNEIINNSSFKILMYYIILMIILNLLCSFVGSIVSRTVTLKQNYFFAKYNWILNKKIMNLDYVDVESFETQEKKERINQMQNMHGLGITNLIHSSKIFTQNFFTIIFSISIVASLFLSNNIFQTDNIVFQIVCSPWIASILGIIVIFNMLVNLTSVSKSTKKIFHSFEGLVPANRVYLYYLDNYVDSYHSGKDIRLYNQSELIEEETVGLIDSLKPSLSKLKLIEFRYAAIGSVSTIVINILIYLFVGLKALAGAITIGSIVQYIGGIQQFVSGFTSFVSQITVLKENNEALKLVLEYLDMAPSMHNGHKKIDPSIGDLKCQIEFKNVSFKYPKTEIEVMKNISLKINTGERIAIVGMNGSGKTTLIKLLTRLYDVDEGEITLNGVNIKEYNTEDYQRLFSVVFQDFKLFSFSLGENIAGSKGIDAAKAARVLNEVDFGKRLQEITLNAMLYKDFDKNGIEISGGEAQKIAIARTLYQSALFFVFDEPTAALDPIAEYQIYKKINDISKNKTAIFISHRMSSCKFCDRIFVFHKGELIQAGSHESLLKDAEGKYYELWNAQSQYYE